jgi:hypothetical protein
LARFQHQAKVRQQWLPNNDVFECQESVIPFWKMFVLMFFVRQLPMLNSVHA